jgi:hypothetical protein
MNILKANPNIIIYKVHTIYLMTADALGICDSTFHLN